MRVFATTLLGDTGLTDKWPVIYRFVRQVRSSTLPRPAAHSGFLVV